MNAINWSAVLITGVVASSFSVILQMAFPKKISEVPRTIDYQEEESEDLYGDEEGRSESPMIYLIPDSE